MSEELDFDDYLDYEDEGCERCGCCDTYWEPCGNCEDGYNDGYEEDPLWYDIGDMVKCNQCNGKGGWAMCIGDCDVHGNHS